jgi:hypothetical protein
VVVEARNQSEVIMQVTAHGDLSLVLLYLQL